MGDVKMVKKIKEETQKKVSYLGVILMATFCMAISLGLLFRNMNWMNGTFFIFGMMFFMGYMLLRLVLQRMRKGVSVNV